MARYRAPGPPRSPYITRQGYLSLQDEQKRLWEQRREVVVHLAAAAAEGDRSENAEYIYRKKQLRELDRRIRYLEVRLPTLKVVDHRPEDTRRIFFGAWVTLVDDTGQEASYRIVGADEFDPKQGWISVDSPLARALLKRSLDERVSVQLPSGRVEYDILAIDYRY